MKSENTLLSETTVYAFHVPSLKAIKVGFGADGRTRMVNYSRQYALNSNATSLREWKLPSPSLASSIETACHRALMEADFNRLSHVVDDREARELFHLGGHAYEDAVLVVADAIDTTISDLYEALGKFSPLKDEKARQRKEETERRRQSIREQKQAAKDAESQRLIGAALVDLKRGWSSESEPFLKACDRAKVVWKQFDQNQGTIDSLWNGKRSAASRMKKWERFGELKKFVVEIFHLGRKAKIFHKELDRKHGESLFHAGRSLGVHTYSPGGWTLTDVGTYPDPRGWPFLEVRLAVQKATGFGGDDASELIDSDVELKELVRYASQNPAPELKYLKS